jgi:hypothetical protein
MSTVAEVEVAAETPIQIINTLDPAKLLSEFEGDCKDRHLTGETIGRYKSLLN